MATAPSWHAFSALALAMSILFFAPASVRRLLFVKYMGLQSCARAVSARHRIIARILPHSRAASMKPVSGQDDHSELRDAVRVLCKRFGGDYWRKIDEERAYPEAFAQALTEAGWLAALIPEEYGGSGLSVTEASMILEEIRRLGAFAGAVHGPMKVLRCVVRQGSK